MLLSPHFLETTGGVKPYALYRGNTHRMDFQQGNDLADNM
jgi:hypothetical protein